jgi:transposase
VVHGSVASTRGNGGGTHSIWVSEQLQELGHEVIVANIRELRAISHSDRKSDQVDAEKLARYARLDPEILRPIAHRTVEQQRGGKQAKSKAVVAVARKLAVLLHRIWMTQEPYEPFYAQAA